MYFSRCTNWRKPNLKSGFKLSSQHDLDWPSWTTDFESNNVNSQHDIISLKFGRKRFLDTTCVTLILSQCVTSINFLEFKTQLASSDLHYRYIGYIQKYRIWYGRYNDIYYIFRTHFWLNIFWGIKSRNNEIFITFWIISYVKFLTFLYQYRNFINRPYYNGNRWFTGTFLSG